MILLILFFCEQGDRVILWSQCFVLLFKTLHYDLMESVLF